MKTIKRLKIMEYLFLENQQEINENTTKTTGFLWAFLI